MTINNSYNNGALPDDTACTILEFEAENIVCYRTLPYAFDINSTHRGCVAKDVRVFYNEDVSRNGAKALVTAIRDYAIANMEQWLPSQLKGVAGTKTLYIVYNSVTDIRLAFSKNSLSIEEVKEANEDSNEDSEVWLSYDISDIGLITLVNRLLSWL